MSWRTTADEKGNDSSSDIYMSWYKNNPNLFVKYGGWNVKGFYKLKNSTSSEMFSRLNRDIIITESDKGYGKCGYLSIDGGKYVAYLPLDLRSGKDVKETIPLEKCCVVVMSKYGEDDIYRIIESEGVTDIDDSRLGVDIFEHVELYDTSYNEVCRRKLNSTELSHLNIYLPGVVADNGHGGYYCKLFAKGSSTQFYNKTVDPLSEVTTNDLFDISKCEVREYKNDCSSEIKIKLFIPKEAKDLSGLDALKQQEKEAEEHRKQRKIKHSISRLESFVDYEDAEIDTINKEYQHLCVLIGENEAEKYKHYVDKAIENVNIREEIKKRKAEDDKFRREKILKKIELGIVFGYWITIWLIALFPYLNGDRESCAELLALFACFGPALLVLIYLPFEKYMPKSNWAVRTLSLLWVLHLLVFIIYLTMVL